MKIKLLACGIGFLLALACLLSCDKSEILGPPIEGVFDIFPKDIANQGDGSDIEVFFSKQFITEDIEEYRVIALKVDAVTALSLEVAENLSQEKFRRVVPEDIFPIKGLRLDANMMDTDGDLITVNTPYRFAVLTVSKDPSRVSNSLLIDDDDFVLRTNNLIFEHTTELSFGSNSLAIDAENNLYMGDFNIHAQLGSTDSPAEFAIHKITSNGTPSKISSEYKLLAGNALDQQDNLYQSVIFSSEVLKITPSGETSSISFPLLQQPDGLYVAPNGRIYIADLGADAVFEVQPDGTTRRFAKVPENPRGITADEMGNLYISHNSADGTISKITPEGEVSVLAYVPATRPANYQLEYIMWVGYILYHEGFLYVAGLTEDQIFKVSLSGEVSVFAGSGTRGIPRGGALSANLNRPLGLAFSQDGSKLFVSGCTDVVPQHTQYSAPGKIWEITIVE